MSPVGFDLGSSLPPLPLSPRKVAHSQLARSSLAALHDPWAVPDPRSPAGVLPSTSPPQRFFPPSPRFSATLHNLHTAILAPATLARVPANRLHTPDSIP